MDHELVQTQQPLSLAEELFGARVAIEATSYAAYLEARENPSGNGFAQLIYSLSEKYRDYINLPDTSESQRWADQQARTYIAGVENMPERFWGAPVDVQDNQTGEKSQIALREFVASMRYQSIWAIEQASGMKQSPDELSYSDAEPHHLDKVRGYIFYTRARNRFGQLISEKSHQPVERGEFSHLDHTRNGTYNTDANLRFVTSWEHWLYHYEHRDCPEEIGLPGPGQNDGAMRKIASRLQPHEREWARQLMAG